MSQRRKIKIAFFTHYTDLYGANKSLLNLICGLQKLYDASVTLIAPAEGKVTIAAQESGIPIIIIPFYNEIYHGIRRGFIKRLGCRLKDFAKHLINRRLAKKHGKLFAQYDILHTNSSVTFFGAYLALHVHKPHIWHIREFGWEDYEISYNFGERYFYRWLNKAAAAVAISQAIFERRLTTTGPSHKLVIYNGVVFSMDMKANAVDITHPRKDRSFTFVIVGAIARGKKQMEAVLAFHSIQTEFPASKLLIAGTGDKGYETELRQYVIAHNLEEKVVFLGFVDQVTEIYRSADCLLMCSESEGLGRVTIEALSFGLPVIGYNNGGTTEIIQDQYNGLLYGNNRGELSGKMKLIIKDGELRNKLKRNAIRSIQKFTVEECTRTLYGLYESILFQQTNYPNNHT